MYRSVIKYLKDWKTRNDRKPLVIRGARQVGKTFMVREFAGEFKNYVEINLETESAIVQYFKSNDPKEIIQLLSLHYNTVIVPGQTLLFFDEIQTAPELFAKLRYFYELLPDLHVIAAGSLLEFILENHEFSMPVGRIEYLHLGPMKFNEFLLSIGEEKLLDFIGNFSLGETMPLPIHQKLVALYKTFIVVGGMPQSIKAFLDNKSFIDSDRISFNTFDLC